MKQSSTPDLSSFFNPCRQKVCLLKQNCPSSIDTSSLADNSISIPKSPNSSRTIEFMQGELVARNNTLADQNSRLKVQIALVEQDNRSLLDKVDRFDEQILSVHKKIKDLLMQQNKQFFEINQQLSQEIMSSKFGESSIRPLRDSNQGYHSQVTYKSKDRKAKLVDRTNMN